MDWLRLYNGRKGLVVPPWEMDFVGASRDDPLVVAALQARLLALGDQRCLDNRSLQPRTPSSLIERPRATSDL